MHNVKDLYPTRTAHRHEMYERLDPVIHVDEDGRRWDGPLSDEELASFGKDGFLMFESFFSEDEIREFREELQRLSGDESLKGWEGLITEPGSDEIRTVFQIHRREISPLFARLARDSRILDRMRQLLASEAYVHQSRINYKPGFKGKGFNWHSDFETWHAEDGMPRMRAVSCSILLTDNTEHNGPLMLVPGSHRYFVPCVGATPEDNYKRSLKVQEAGVPDSRSLSALVDEGGLRSFTGPAGSMLFFECNTLHASNANMSPFPRSNVFFVYNSVRNTPVEPFAADRRRPEFLGERTDFTPLRH